MEVLVGVVESNQDRSGWKWLGDGISEAGEQVLGANEVVGRGGQIFHLGGEGRRANAEARVKMGAVLRVINAMVGEDAEYVRGAVVERLEEGNEVSKKWATYDEVSEAIFEPTHLNLPLMWARMISMACWVTVSMG